MLTARDIMTQEVITVFPETPISELAQIIKNRNIGGLPVVDPGDGRLVGIITQSDLVDRVRELELPPALNILDLHLFLEIPSHLFHRVEKMLATTVGEAMSAKPVTVNLDTPVPKIASLMAKEKTHTIPVMERGKIVGIIGKMDLVQAMVREEGE